jgi:hypothetical protein
MPQSDPGLDELLEGLAHEWYDEMEGWFEQALDDVTKQGKEHILKLYLYPIETEIGDYCNEENRAIHEESNSR